MAMNGLVVDRPARSSMFLLLHRHDAGEGAERHDEVDQHVGDDAGDAGFGSGGEPH
jgi:hypothetical protein